MLDSVFADISDDIQKFFQISIIEIAKRGQLLFFLIKSHHIDIFLSYYKFPGSFVLMLAAAECRRDLSTDMTLFSFVKWCE